MTEGELKDALFATRDRLRKELSENGHTPHVCSDDAINEMLEKKPKKFSDFKQLSSIDETFLNIFFDEFYRILTLFHRNNLPKVSLNNQSEKVLKRYNARLSEIARDNKNLRVRQIGKHSLDLSDKLSIGLLDTLFETPKDFIVRLTNRELSHKMDQNFYNQLKHLNLEHTAHMKQNGNMSLYLTFPYVEGRYYTEEDFFIKAPLLYIPMKLYKQDVDYYLSFDD